MVEALIFDYGGVISDGGRDFEPAIRLASNLAIDQSSAINFRAMGSAVEGIYQC